MNALDHFSEEEQAIIFKELTARDPLLLRHLQEYERPTLDDRVAWEESIGRAAVGELTMPDWEPTELGRKLEGLIDKFLRRWPTDMADEE